MPQLIQTLSNKLKAHAQQGLVSAETAKTHWQKCADIYYLLDTVKISYNADFGNVTLENMHFEEITDCIHSLTTLQKGRVQSPLTITVCGVTWDVLTLPEQDMQHRVRAIPKAAGLRYFADNCISSDAYFYQASQLALDAVPSDYFSDRKIGEAKAVSALTLKQFLHKLQQNNQQFLQQYGKPLHLHKANFEEPMTEHEQGVLEHFFNQATR